MPWIIWMAGWIANKYIRGKLTKFVIGGIAESFDLVDNILPYAEAFNEFVNTLFGFWSSGTFPNVVYFEPHGNFYRWDFPRPYTVEMAHFPEAFVSGQAGLLSRSYKTVSPFLFYDVADLMDDTLQTDQLTKLETKTEPIEASQIMGNIWDKRGDRARAFCSFGVTKPQLGGGFTEEDAFPFNNCVRWEQYGGWSYKAVAFKAFRKFSPLKSDGVVFFKGGTFYRFDEPSGALNSFPSPRNANVLYDDNGVIKRNGTEVFFNGQMKKVAGAWQTYNNGQWNNI